MIITTITCDCGTKTVTPDNNPSHPSSNFCCGFRTGGLKQLPVGLSSHTLILISRDSSCDLEMLQSRLYPSFMKNTFKKRRNSLKSANIYLTFLFTFCSRGNEQHLLLQFTPSKSLLLYGDFHVFFKGFGASTLSRHHCSVSRCQSTSSPRGGGLVLISSV